MLARLEFNSDGSNSQLDEQARDGGIKNSKRLEYWLWVII